VQIQLLKKMELQFPDKMWTCYRQTTYTSCEALQLFTLKDYFQVIVGKLQ